MSGSGKTTVGKYFQVLTFTLHLLHKTERLEHGKTRNRRMPMVVLACFGANSRILGK